MTRGFITIATGKELYYTLADNLLKSYKLFTENPYPFAILCDRENEVTAEFDDVVILEHPLNSFWDKFELLKLAPYDETIFIDADCLAYADLNAYWDYFRDADDFSGSGCNYPIDSERGLFQKGQVAPFNDRVHWKPDICGGLYFIRKGSVCDQLYADCQYICQHYDDYTWPDYCAPRADETVLCLAMAANGLHALDADPANYGIPWEVTHMEQDLLTGKLRYATEWHPMVEQGKLIHFSTPYCKKPIYIVEAEKLHMMLQYGFRPGSPMKLSLKDTILYRWNLRYYWLTGKDLAIRAVRKGLRMLKIIK